MKYTVAPRTQRTNDGLISYDPRKQIKQIIKPIQYGNRNGERGKIFRLGVVYFPVAYIRLHFNQQRLGLYEGEPVLPTITQT